MDLDEQLNWFRKGFPDVRLMGAAVPGDGIMQLDPSQQDGMIEKYEASEVFVEKFVPASGAATRMFRDLLEYRASGKSSKSVDTFFGALDKLPFALSGSRDEVLAELFDKRGYQNLPKGLLPFHQKDGKTLNPAEEHLAESIGYAMKQGPVKIHFTVSPEHEQPFEALIEKAKNEFDQEFEITYSTQNPETDTVAVDLENNPVRLENGDSLYRPAGHGALLENLNTRNSDLIFIKNIDNVVPDRLKGETVKWKKILAGVLLDFQAQVFELLRDAERGNLDVEKAKKLLEKCGIKDISDSELVEKLNRPMRVCGMVKNSGEPGGGPFWVESNGQVSLQIVEGAQIDKSNQDQVDVLNQSTHFNPVDIVCGVKDYKGQKFDLMKYTDPTTGFITQKSHNGQPIKALELPGLWNGGMADWNTIFVEVPLITFNPVKTVNDLLRPEHQP